MDKSAEQNLYKSTDLLGCLHLTLKIMKYGAYWLPKNVTKWEIIYYVVMAISTTYISIFTEITFLVFKARTLEDIVDSASIILTHASQGLKLVFFLIWRKRLLALLDLLETNMFKPKNRRQYETTMKTVIFMKRLLHVMLVVVSGCSVFYVAYPVMEKKGAKALPANAIWPFKFAETHYGIVYGYQAFTISLIAFANCATDITAAAFMTQVCVQLEILSDNLVHIKDLAENRLPVKTDNGNDIQPDLQKEMDATLTNCVKHHLLIVDFAKQVESVFSVPIFFQMFTAVGTICMTLFQMSMVTNFFTVRFTFLTTYMCCMVVEITIFCWYGNEITVKSQKLWTSIYNTDWVGCNKEYQRKILFVMMNMQRVIQLRVGNMVDLSVENLVAVYRTSWSYFLVLYNMRD